MTFRTERPKDCGIITLDEQKRIKSYWEKDYSAIGNLANAAIYIVDKEFLGLVEKTKGNDLSKDIIARTYHRFNVFENETYHADIGTLASYSLAQIQYKQIKDKV